MPTIEANGLETTYEVAGAGPPLVMLHGATTSGAECYAGFADGIARGFRVYLPDARGHAGTADGPAGEWATAALVADLAGFVDALGLSTFHLLGYSMGGMTALTFAARYPERLRTLVAMSIGTDREPRLSVARSLMDPDRIERNDPGWARFLAARHDGLHGRGAWKVLLRAIVDDIAAQPLLTPAEIRAIDAPTLVVAGDHDPFTPVAQADALARQVEDGRLLILPGVGHDVLGSARGILDVALPEFYRSTEAVARDRAGEATPTEVRG
jgi:pimeloyl-ACP methyl ester carboxylesterase